MAFPQHAVGDSASPLTGQRELTATSALGQFQEEEGQESYPDKGMIKPKRTNSAVMNSATDSLFAVEMTVLERF